MNGLGLLAKAIILVGVLLIVVGSILLFTRRAPFPGKLPGDLHVKHRNISLYFPITTCILLSLVLTLVLNLLLRR